MDLFGSTYILLLILTNTPPNLHLSLFSKTRTNLFWLVFGRFLVSRFLFYPVCFLLVCFASWSFISVWQAEKTHNVACVEKDGKKMKVKKKRTKFLFL